MMSQLLFILLFLFTFSHSTLHAATVVPSDGTAQTTVIDGVTVIYDDEAVDGGIQHGNASQTTVIDGVTVQYDNTVPNGGISQEKTTQSETDEQQEKETPIQLAQEESTTETTSPSTVANIQDYPSGYIVYWYEPERLFPILLLLSIGVGIIVVITLLIRKLIRRLR